MSDSDTCIYAYETSVPSEYGENILNNVSIFLPHKFYFSQLNTDSYSYIFIFVSQQLSVLIARKQDMYVMT